MDIKVATVTAMDGALIAPTRRIITIKHTPTNTTTHIPPTPNTPQTIYQNPTQNQPETRNRFFPCTPIQNRFFPYNRFIPCTLIRKRFIPYNRFILYNRFTLNLNRFILCIRFTLLHILIPLAHSRTRSGPCPRYPFTPNRNQSTRFRPTLSTQCWNRSIR